MKRKLCIMLLVVALFLIGISALFAYAPPQVNAGDLCITQNVKLINNFTNEIEGTIPTILDDGLFARGRIT